MKKHEKRINEQKHYCERSLGTNDPNTVNLCSDPDMKSFVTDIKFKSAVCSL